MDTELQALLLDIFRKADFATNEPTYVETVDEAVGYFEEIRIAIMNYVEKQDAAFQVEETEEDIQYVIVHRGNIASR